MWGMWLLTMDVFFDIAGFYHTYYLVMIAPAIAALSGIGVVALWRAFRESDSKLWWLLPASLLAVAAVQVHILGDYPAWSRWMSPLILALAVLGALVLTVLRLVPGLRFRPVLAALLIGVTALLAAPGVWSFETVQAANAGITPRAGPAGTTGMGGPGGAGFRPGNGSFGPPNGSFPPPGAQSGVGGGNPPAFGPPPGGSGSSSTGSSGRMQDTPTGGFRMNGGGPGDDQVNKTLLRFLEAHQGNATYLFATPSAGTAEAYIIAGGKAVMAMGGFTGSDPILTPSKLATLAGEGRVKYFLVSGGGFGGPGGNSSLTSWIQQHSKLITVAGTQLYEYTG
jgi:4-amino-4-deoxy-L-arabinose transferase-like glycosyltransferase